MPEALRATKNPCSRQHLHRLCNKHGVKRPIVITVDNDEVSTLNTESESSADAQPKKQRKKSAKEKNAERVAQRQMMVQMNKQRNDALKEGQELYEYACSVKQKVKRNKKYIKQEIQRNDLFIVPMNTRQIVSHVNKKYGVRGDEKVLSKSSLLRYYNEGIKERKKMGAPPTVPLILLNAMRLHIKVLQISKQGQASGTIIKSKLVAAARGTEHDGFNSGWA